MSQQEITSVRNRIREIDAQLETLPLTATTEVDRLVSERVKLQSRISTSFGV